jgi:ABC-type glycerol-3-phosphate transport system permease component
MAFALISAAASIVGIVGFWINNTIVLYVGTAIMILVNHFARYKLSRYKLIGGITTTLLIAALLIGIGIPALKAISICLCYENLGIICATVIFKLIISVGKGVNKENG